MRTRRPLAMALVALSGIAIGAGGLLPWVVARGSRPRSGIMHTSIAGLFRWEYENATFIRSFGAVMVLCGVLVLIGGLVASRVLAVLFSLVALATAGLWIGLNASHFNPTDMPYSDLRIGAWLSIGGGIVGLVSAFFLRRRSYVSRASETYATG
ncbi:MAG TPA: hypothetical protein VGJ63_11875 [Micromonosporaceae bacterium]